VRIRHRAAALNFFDILEIAGKYQVKPPFPFVPGAEAAGVVEAVGDDVRRVRPGDRVCALLFGGGYGEASVIGEEFVFRIPDAMSFEDAATLILVYHTSYFALRTRATLEAGEWLLVHAGASGTGMAAIQLGKAFGARVIATASSEAKLEFCGAQGADHVLNYTGAAWVDEVKRLTGGRGADVIYDPVGGDVFELSTRCIAPEGRLLVVGFAGGRIPTLAMNRVLLKDISIVGVHWGPFAKTNAGYMDLTQAALEEMYRAGKIRPGIGKRIRLEEIPQTLREVSERKLIGKAVVLFD
jgi:NADPH2:quinone reductase